MSATAIDAVAPIRGADAAPPLNRMIMAVLALIGVVIAGYMFLYKIGAIPAVACGNGACETVQASPWAIFVGVPVPLIGLIGYGALLAVTLIGVQPAWADDRKIGATLVLLSTVAFAFSIYLSGVEAFLIGAWCRWCIGSAVVATLLFLGSLAELPRLRRRSDV